MKVAVIGVKKVDFMSKEGKSVKGTKVFYLMRNDEDDSAIKGFKVADIFVSAGMFDVFDQVPGEYDLQFEVIPGGGGRPKTELVGVEFIKSLSLEEI